ncbi:hypothetical protein MBLNU457_5084t2 [Dothideomycetes sp. NU457]
MPLSRLDESDEEEYETIERSNTRDVSYDNGKEEVDQPENTRSIEYHGQRQEEYSESLSGLDTPMHPVPGMQEAFEESIREAIAEDFETDSLDELDAEARRRALLDREDFDDSWTTRWKQKPSARCHPIVKLMAQIIFGLHLLHHQQAKSDAEVVVILQGHVDEIDGFLEKTTEDFELAIRDIEERIQFLQLPMKHVEVFDVMLQDRRFRHQLVSGNVKIEKIIERTAKAMNASLLDVRKGINTVQQLSEYLDKVGADWPQSSVEEAAILVAMRGNEEGWRACFSHLQAQGNKLGVVLVELGTIVAEMNKMAASASKRKTNKSSSKDASSVPMSKYADGSHSKTLNDKDDSAPKVRDTTSKAHAKYPADGTQSQKRIVDKPLPKAPDMIDAAVKAEPHESPSTKIAERPSTPLDFMQSKQPRSLPSATNPSETKTEKSRSTPQMEPRAPCSPTTSQTKDLAGFLRDDRSMDDRGDHNCPTSLKVEKRSQRAQQPQQAKLPESAEVVESSHSRNASDSVPRSLPAKTDSAIYSDSAYASGIETDQKADNKISPPSRTPSKFGLFPNAEPTTPVIQSRSPSLGVKTASPNYTTAPGRAVSAGNEDSRSPSFSLRKMFNKKQTEQSVSG